MVASQRRRRLRPRPRNESTVPARDRRRIFGAYAAHLRCCDLRSSLPHQRMRSLRCSAAPSIWAAWPPNLSSKAPAVTVAITLAYLLAAVLFILGLKQLSSPKGARNGNFTAALGMVVALAATLPLLHFTRTGITIIAIGVTIGTVVGVVGARLVRMTAIPQMVALFNGVGGGAAALVAVAELLKLGDHPALSLALPSVLMFVTG